MLAADHSHGGHVTPDGPPARAGDVRLHASFRSRFLEAERDVLVYVPPGYDSDEGRRYPVLYLHDGQNLFDGATSFVPGQHWRAGETAQELIAAREVEPLVIVGVYNTGRARADEYTPTHDGRFRVGGKADLYGRLLTEELKPFVDARYRTRAAAEDTGLGGSSLGGLVSLYLGLRYPRVYGRLAVLSPSVWWGGGMILKEVRSLGPKPETRVWLDTGTGEGEPALRNVRYLRDALTGKGWRLGEDLSYLEDDGAGHNELAWAGRFARVLKFLFPPRV
jgi:predicted alpha/beta superfamily hydrolase